MKYIFVSGGVISGIGKGIATASMAMLLKSAGFKVVPIKFDPYLNIDAGTMNPIEHGEVFVLDDGAETDQDLGHYERFLNESLNKHSIATQGSIYWTVLQKERNLEYGGTNVDVVTHITEEILRRIDLVAKDKDVDVVFIEIGGTAGEYQNMLFLEANRLLKIRKPDDVIHVHITYLPIPHSIGEMKSKPAQMSVRDLNAVGIQPDIILARAERSLDSSRIKKLAMSTGLEPEDIISAPDVTNIYEVPLNFEEQGLTNRILKKLRLKRKSQALSEWRGFVSKVNKSQKQEKTIKIGIVGKYFATGDFTLADAYISVIEAIKHASFSLGFKPEIAWLDAGKVLAEVDLLKGYQGIIVPGGFGSRDIEGKIATIKYCRENKIPYLGLCYGMQMASIEFARNVLGLTGANTTEVNSTTKCPVIHIMPDQEKKLLKKDYGATMRLGAWDCVLKKDTLTQKLYAKNETSERHRHRYEFNNEYRAQYEAAGFVFSGTSPDGKLVEIIELPGHPFFIGTQFHPELKSRPLSPHPLFVGFIKAAAR
ncbi:CTP synthase [Candidatus Daviesbacteria bacterium RIFCSPHIGHO2_01_FULL_44_29]|uniref:CTP synthase n=1 Tax=Candidatus Daviesbacteria bacterium RIFCSPHIGHO2_02_FULL_43_12 TaxID=1797776 RepID=A0A1F5KII4_9BACT|nr:MAG: CTP synthase [Candidatus Daviesbacteria bacterium RIFCSPHIGHO2_01_FULL_44_29]OGE40649.1 MAG: CTP synthase [Candidatus Daviesbacteria bacterium RIFCSPHIGHO2_02_FULL_43_12]OGE69855.1 MAG: CTP synthase [Candidatus Daviesbacteria bacterium RIFCSPLOWO2_01_FULL_43_15]